MGTDLLVPLFLVALPVLLIIAAVRHFNHMDPPPLPLCAAEKGE